MHQQLFFLNVTWVERTVNILTLSRIFCFKVRNLFTYVYKFEGNLLIMADSLKHFIIIIIFLNVKVTAIYSAIIKLIELGMNSIHITFFF